MRPVCDACAAGRHKDCNGIGHQLNGTGRYLNCECVEIHIQADVG